MRALVIDVFGELPGVREVPEPACPPDGVVLDVRATGVCRSDWHAFMGHDADVVLPHVPGHELAGVVRLVGIDVTGWAPGDRVTVPFVCACGRCEQCLDGQQQVCADQRQPGFTQWGSFAEQVVIERAATNLVALPDELDFATAASLGCRFSTAFHALVDQAGLQPGQWVAVHGCGGVGLSAVMIAVASGARVVAVDLSAEALAAARRFGAEAVVEGSDPDVAGRIRRTTGGGAHVSMDALGHTDTCLNSISCLRIRGTHVQVGLMLAEHALPPVPMGLVLARELRVVGSHGMAAHGFARLLDLVAAGTLQPQQLIRRRIGLDDAARELSALGDAPGHGGMTVIEFPA